MKAMLKKVLSVLLVVTITAGVAITGTLAYLTDRDSEANVFTVGDVSIDLDEDFEQGSELIPGVDIEKEATITNTGKNDAYVWMTLAIPSVLDVPEAASDNVIHWNVPGAFWDAYYNQEKYINSAIENGYLPEGSTGVAADKTWNVDDAVAMYKTTIDEVEYNVYTLLYNSAIKPGETTNIGLNKVYMDDHIDIDPNGDWYHVLGGEVKGPFWNTATNGNPVIYVSTYAMQSEGLTDANVDGVIDVKDAYALYNTQWDNDDTLTNGSNGDEWAEVTQVASNTELDQAIKDGATTIVLGDGNYIIPDSAKGKTLNIIGSGDTVIVAENDGASEGNGDYSFDGATVTFQNVTINTTGTYFPGYPRMKGTFVNCTINGVYTLYESSSFENCTFNVTGDFYNVWTWGAAEATFDGCTFNCDGKAVLLYGTANTKLTMNNCVFNDNGDDTVTGKTAIEIGNDYGKSYEVIVNNATVNGFAENSNGIPTNTTLWSNKNSMGTDKLNVVVDGADVY